jgi:integrase
MRSRLLEQGRFRDATMVALLAYAGLRPQEALALQWRHVRERTLLVEHALSDGQAEEPRESSSAAYRGNARTASR